MKIPGFVWEKLEQMRIFLIYFNVFMLVWPNNDSTERLNM